MRNIDLYRGGSRGLLGGQVARIPSYTAKPYDIETPASARYKFAADMVRALTAKAEKDKKDKIRSSMLAAMIGPEHEYDPSKASESFTPSEYVEAQRVALADAQALIPKAKKDKEDALFEGALTDNMASSIDRGGDALGGSVDNVFPQQTRGEQNAALDAGQRALFGADPASNPAMQKALIGDIKTPLGYAGDRGGLPASTEAKELAAYAGSAEDRAVQERAYTATVNTPDAVAARMAEAVRLNPDIAKDPAYAQFVQSHVAEQQRLRAESTARDRAVGVRDEQRLYQEKAAKDKHARDLQLKNIFAPKAAASNWEKVIIENEDGTQQLVFKELNSGRLAKNADGTYATAPSAEGVSSEVRRELQDIRRTYLAGDPALFNMKVNEEAKRQEKLTGRTANVEEIKRNLLERYGLASPPSSAASDVNVNPVLSPVTSAPVSAVAPAESWLSPAEEGDFAFVKTGTDESGNPVYGIQASDSVFDIADQEKAGQRTKRQTAATSQINRQAGVFDDRPANYLEGRTRREVLRSEMQRKSTDRQAIKQEGGFLDAYGTQVENIRSENIAHNEKIDYWAKGLQTNYFGARGALDAIDSILAFDGNVAPLEPLTGTLAPAMAMIKESPAGQISSHMDTLKSQVVLQSMMMLKAASATGSTGFGQLNQKELQTLIDSLGKLEMSTEWDITKQTLNRAKKFFEQRLSFTDGIIESEADAKALGVFGIWKDMEENRERFEAGSLQIRPEIEELYRQYVPQSTGQ
jgi:hypothetical protein